MNNKDYAALLGENETSVEERMGAIAKIIERELEDLTEQLAKDHSLVGKINANHLREEAATRFKKMGTGLEADYRLNVEVQLDMQNVERYWWPRVRYKKQFHFDGISAWQSGSIDMESEQWRLRRNGTIDTHQLSRDMINAINDSQERVSTQAQTIGDVWQNGDGIDRMMAGTIQTASITAQEINTEGLTTDVVRVRPVEYEFGGFYHTVDATPFTATPFTVSRGEVLTPEEAQPLVFQGEVEVVERDLGAIDVQRDELREATWDARSLREDMQAMNQERIISEIRRGFEYIIEEHRNDIWPERMVNRMLEREAEEFLLRMQEEGRITEYTVADIREENYVDGRRLATMNARVQLPQTVDTINVSVHIVP